MRNLGYPAPAPINPSQGSHHFWHRMMTVWRTRWHGTGYICRNNLWSADSSYRQSWSRPSTSWRVAPMAPARKIRFSWNIWAVPRHHRIHAYSIATSHIYRCCCTPICRCRRVIPLTRMRADPIGDHLCRDRAGRPRWRLNQSMAQRATAAQARVGGLAGLRTRRIFWAGTGSVISRIASWVPS